MGLLDEAIREHLELKRAHGADPTELDRLEREALGPVRRGPEDAPEAGMADEGAVGGPYPAVEEDAPYPPEDEVPEWTDSGEEPVPFDHGSGPAAGVRASDDWSEPPTALNEVTEDETGELGEPGYDPPRHHEIAEEWEAHERGTAAEPAGFEPDEPAPAPPAPVPEPHGLEQETEEYQVEEEIEPGAEGEDMLEETPDFLQDTPDHDRLWFEQRPPRDFDFDG